jgi:E3 ubiquitin-protein transferase RMND5
MDSVHAELVKLHTLSGPGQGKWPSITNSLDSLLDDLRTAKERLLQASGEWTPTIVSESTLHVVEGKKKAVDERQKEVYNCINRLAKNLDKVRCAFLASPSPILLSEISKYSSDMG